MNSDFGFALLFGNPEPRELARTVATLTRPFPAGLLTGVGLVVANPAHAPGLQTVLTPNAYHGAVVWSWQQAMFAAGLERQLRRTDLPPDVRAALRGAQAPALDGDRRHAGLPELRTVVVDLQGRGVPRGAVRRVGRRRRRVQRRPALEHRLPRHSAARDGALGRAALYRGCSRRRRPGVRGAGPGAGGGAGAALGGVRPALRRRGDEAGLPRQQDVRRRHASQVTRGDPEGLSARPVHRGVASAGATRLRPFPRPRPTPPPSTKRAPLATHIADLWPVLARRAGLWSG